MTANIEYTGHLRCKCTHVQSGTVIETDAPTDNLGKGERFSPTDTVCVALATCMITTMGIRAQDMAVELSGTKLEVTKHMLANPFIFICPATLLSITKKYYSKLAIIARL